MSRSVKTTCIPCKAMFRLVLLPMSGVRVLFHFRPDLFNKNNVFLHSIWKVFLSCCLKLHSAVNAKMCLRFVFLFVMLSSVSCCMALASCHKPGRVVSFVVVSTRFEQFLFYLCYLM